MANAKAAVLGKTTKKNLPELFSEPFHQSLVHESARADMAARRRGTASSLTRGEVSMTTAKAWRQKGTGRARVGALSAPSRYGGGAAFGPKPRSYVVKVNRKARRRALRSAFGVHAERGSVATFEAADFDTPSTKQAVTALDGWGAKRSTLVIITGDEVGALKSFRNIPEVQLLEVGQLNTHDVLVNGVDRAVPPGRVVADFGPSGLAATLQRIVHDPGLRRSMSEAARERARSGHGMERYLTRWEDVLRVVVHH